MAPPRTQCSPCDAHGLSCDRALPVCSACRTHARVCSFAVRISWDTRNSDTLLLAPSHRLAQPQPQPQPRHSLSLTPDHSSLQRASLHHFIHGVAPTLCAIDSIPSDNPNLFYLPLALSPSRASDALLHALVAAGSAHQLNWGVAVDPAAVKKHEYMALAQLERDLVTLAAKLVHGRASDGELVERVNEALATAQVLILYSTTVGDTKLWRKHLQVAAGLLSQVVRVRAQEGKPPLRLNRFLVEMLRFTDVQSGLSSQTATIISNEVAVDEWPPDQLVAASSATLINGFSQNFRPLISRICTVAQEVKEQRRHSNSPPAATNPLDFGGFSPTPFDFSLIDPWDPFRQNTNTPPSHSAHPAHHSSTSPLYHQSAAVGSSTHPSPSGSDDSDSRAVDVSPAVAEEIYLIRRGLDECRANLHHMAQDPAVQRAFQTRLLRPDQLEGQLSFADSIYYSCHVYISRMLEVTPVLSKAAMSQVWKGLAVMAKVPFDASSNLLSWSLVVIGCELQNDDPAREIVRGRLKALEALGHLNFNQTRVLVEEVWRRKDAWRPGEPVVTWQGVMKDMDWDVFIV